MQNTFKLLTSPTVWLLPVAIILPEIINIGIFLRWDYFVLIWGFYILMNDAAIKLTTNQKNLMMALIVFTLYLVIRIPDFSDMEAVKMATWPIKIGVWSIGIYAIFRHYDTNEKIPVSAQMYGFFAVFSVLLLFVEFAELAFAPVRAFLLEFYPIGAADRLEGIDFRTRAVFNGYDTCSMFFCLAGICFTFCKQNVEDFLNDENKTVFDIIHKALILVCLLGSLLAARTGFLLFAGFLLVNTIGFKIKSDTKLILACFFISFCLAMVVIGPNISGQEGTLLGRYLEVFNVISSGGDPTSVNSFFGTLYMNYILFAMNPWDPVLGQGIITKTTADQLYAKYLYMLGTIGLTFWMVLQIYATAKLKQVKNCPLASTCYAFSIVVFIAHIKGGNYYFSQRLGDVSILLLFAGFYNSAESVSSKLKSLKEFKK